MSPGAIRGQLFGLFHRGDVAGDDSTGETRPATWGLVRPGT